MDVSCPSNSQINFYNIYRRHLNSMQENKGYLKTQSQSQAAVEDMVLSISHRLSILEAGLSSKIDRSQCMLIMQSKANFSQFERAVEEITSKFDIERRLADEKLAEQQKESRKEVEKLRQRLRNKRKEDKKASNDKNVMVMRPQELFLESNETMFSIIVDELSTLKQGQQALEKGLEQRNKVTISLNNEVCTKIENLQRQFENSIKSLKTIKEIKKQSVFEDSHQSWSHSEGMDSRVKQCSKNNFHRTESNNNNKTCTQLHQTSHILRTIESLQRDLASKINIKDVLPIIKKNLQPLSITMDEIRKYCEEAIESTKKILINQSEINQELCTVSKMGWWYSFEEKNGLAVWNKELSNLVPEVLSYSKDTSDIELQQHGLYIIKVMSLGEEMPETIMVGNEVIEMMGECLVKVDKNTTISIPSSGGQIFLSILKL